MTKRKLKVKNSVGYIAASKSPGRSDIESKSIQSIDTTKSKGKFVREIAKGLHGKPTKKVCG